MRFRRMQTGIGSVLAPTTAALAALLLARLFEMTMSADLAHDPLAVHLLLKTAQGAVDALIVTNLNLGYDQLNHLFRSN